MGAISLARDSTADLKTLTVVLATAQRGAHVEAANLAAAALAGGLEHPLLFNVAALDLEKRGNLDEAERLLRRAVTIAPRDIGARNALGLCLLRMERPAQALIEFTALLELDPALPFVHASMGNTYFALGLVREAEASYGRALDLDSSHGVAHAGLATIASSRGAYDEARSHAEKSLAVLPGFPDAVMSLAAADLGERKLADAEALLRTLLADSRLSVVERAHANGMLGDVLDAKKYTEEAFAAYSLCNQALRRRYAARYADTGNALVYVQVLNDIFALTPRDVWAVRTSADSRRSGATAHVFLLGFPRSGTTLLEVILEGHSGLVSLEENESMIDAVDEFARQPHDVELIASASLATLERLRDAYWRHVAAAGVDVRGRVFVDKNPLNTLKLPLIARLFPDAKILFACRDPRDIVLSCFRQRFKMSAPIYELLSLEGAARYYDVVMQLAVRFTSMLPLSVCLIRHEDVVTDFMREMTRICGFLGIEWHPGMGDFSLRVKNRETLTPSTAQLVKGLSTEGLGQWRRYRPFLDGVLPVLDPWVKRFYYEP